MLISDDKAFIFVHNRKAAGTSVRRRLAPFALAPPSGRLAKALSRAGLRRDYRRCLFRRHAPIRIAQARMPADRFNRYFKFAFVRNPWDRLISEYEFIRGFPGHARHSRIIRMTSLAEFVDYQATRPDAFQLELLRSDVGELAVDFVGRFERLEDDFTHVCDHLGLAVEPLPRLNASQRRDYRSYYDEATAQRVAEIWGEEIERFGYRFDSGAEGDVSHA